MTGAGSADIENLDKDTQKYRHKRGKMDTREKIETHAKKWTHAKKRHTRENEDRV